MFHTRGNGSGIRAISVTSAEFQSKLPSKPINITPSEFRNRCQILRDLAVGHKDALGERMTYNYFRLRLEPVKNDPLKFDSKFCQLRQYILDNLD